MALQETDVAPPRIAFGPTLRAAFGAVFGRFGTFLRIAAAPFLAGVAILVADLTLSSVVFVDALPLDPQDPAVIVLQILLALVGLLPAAWLGIATTRSQLLGSQPRLLPPPAFGRRSLVYTGYLLLLGLIVLLLAIIGLVAGLGLIEMAGLSQGTNVGAAIVGGFAGLCLLLYLTLRLSLVLPAVALDRKLGVLGAWRLTRGHGLKLLAIFLLLGFLGLLIMLLGSLLLGGTNVRIGTSELVVPFDPGTGWVDILLASLPRNLWTLLANTVGWAIGIGALTAVYAQLSGYNKAREDILVRFD